MYPRSSAVVGLDRIAYEAMWAVHLGRTYGTGQHRHKKWSMLQTVMARAGYDSTPHSQPAASGPTTVFLEYLVVTNYPIICRRPSFRNPIAVNWILGETGENRGVMLLDFSRIAVAPLCLGTQQGLIINTFLEIGYKKPKDQKVDVHRKEQTGRRT
jgi:hypothetical protein